MADKSIPVKLKPIERSLLSRINSTFNGLEYNPIEELILMTRNPNVSVELKASIHSELGRYLYDIEHNIMQNDNDE